MEQVIVSSRGQIAIPKAVRDALNLSEGTKLTLASLRLRAQRAKFTSQHTCANRTLGLVRANTARRIPAPGRLMEKIVETIHGASKNGTILYGEFVYKF